MKIAPARTRTTRGGAFTARQRAWADSMSLNAIASPAAREPGPLVTLVTLVRWRTVAKLDSIGLVVRRWAQVYLRWRTAQGSPPRHAGRPAPRARPRPRRTPATLGPSQTQGFLSSP